jgi:hypothetical protein
MVALMLAALLSAEAARAQAPSGSKLSYTVEWRLITAGTAQLEHSPNQLLLKLASAGLVSKLYRVEDVYTVTYDQGLCATSLHLDAQEGRRRRDTKVTYDRSHNHADYLERDLVKNVTAKQLRIDTPNCVHDVLGALVALRAAPPELGKTIELPVSDGKKFAQVKVDAQEREVLKIKGQQVKTVRYEASIFGGVIYARKGRLFVWLTDDVRRSPIQIQARMSFPIGTVTLTLDKEETL